MMVFANLFASLSAVEDKSADLQLASTCRNVNEKGRPGKPGKRKAHWEQSGPFPKKQCYQDGKPRINNAAGYDFTTQRHNIPNTDGTHESVPVSKHSWQNCKDNFGDRNMCQKHNSRNKSNGKRKKVQNNNKYDGQKNQGARGKSHWPRFMSKGGNGKHGNQAFQERPRFMTQEFKDQNAVEVDGQLLCRHFLQRKCIKGDDCQLKHVQGYNDLIKLSCKFYIQGFCLKGDSCPYMHKSFPCRFFHRGGRCLQEANCRFSHDPLNDVTSKLLEEAIKRDIDLYEQAKAAEQRPAGAPVDAEQSVTLDTNKLPDLFLQPLRPNFYKSSDDGKTVEEPLTSQTEDLKCELTMGTDKPQEVDSVEAQSPPAAKPDSPEPVCYSVEAVLGPQLFRPSTHLFTFPGGKEFVPLSSSGTPKPTDQTQAPYSVDAVLNSLKSVEGYNSGHMTRTPDTQTVSFTPIKAGEVAGPPKSSQVQGSAKEKSESQENSLTSVMLSKDLNSKNWTKPSQAFRDHQQQQRDGWLCSNSAQSSTYKVKLDNVSNDIESSSSVASEGVTVAEQAKQSSMLSREGASSKFSVLTADSHSSSKRFSSKFDLKTTNISESGAGCDSPLTRCSDSAAECKNTPTQLFHSLFKAPLMANLLPAADSISSSSPNNSAVSSCPASKSTRCQSEHLKTWKQDKAVAAGSSLSLSAAPADAAPVPQSDDNPTGSSEVHRSSSNVEMSLSLQAKAEEKSPNPKARRQRSHKCANQPPEHQVALSGTAALSDGTQKQPSDVASHKEAAPAKSVLKTLFLCLSPYQQDCGGNSAPSGRGDQSSSQVVVGRRQTESRGNGAQKNCIESSATQVSLQAHSQKDPESHFLRPDLLLRPAMSATSLQKKRLHATESEKPRITHLASQRRQQGSRASAAPLGLNARSETRVHTRRHWEPTQRRRHQRVIASDRRGSVQPREQRAPTQLQTLHRSEIFSGLLTLQFRTLDSKVGNVSEIHQH
ncbi:uncharacterized protein LOC142894583 isoform X2 [Nelusetta ayraudi]|uniref:uncharacterized protein LOC142894583 isoform X2 n=1 Tax=Nelusetta ayraudi TaxID=303726 RepID=UPI003F730DA7